MIRVKSKSLRPISSLMCVFVGALGALACTDSGRTTPTQDATGGSAGATGDAGSTATGGSDVANGGSTVSVTDASVPVGDASTTSPEPPAKSNVVVILADDLGWVDISVGSTNLNNPSVYYETPNLERMAHEGMSFTSAYTAPNCAPTRGMYTSGQYMTRTQIYNVQNLNRGTGLFLGPEQKEDIEASSTTIYEMMRSAGYTTAHFGKYHVGGHEGGMATLPEQQGVDFNFGGGPAGNPGNYFPTSPEMYGSNVGPALDAYAAPYTQSFFDGFLTYSLDGQSPGSFVFPASMLNSDKHLGDAMNQAAVEFIAAHAGDEKPFFIQYNPFLVHTPIQARPDLEQTFDTKLQQGGADLRGHDNPKYAAMVNQVDQSVGRILATLTDPNGDGDSSDSIAENTLVIFTSDNGGHVGPTNNAPLKGRKGMFTEGGTRVPLIAWQPGTIEADSINNALINSVDYYTTLAEWVGADLSTVPQTLDGVPFTKELLGTPVQRDKSVYWHFPGYLDTRAAPTSAILTEVDGVRYKLLYYYESQSYSLYNIDADIGESNDLLDTAAERTQHAALATALSTELRAFLDDTGAIYPVYKDGPQAGNPVPPPEPL